MGVRLLSQPDNNGLTLGIGLKVTKANDLPTGSLSVHALDFDPEVGLIAIRRANASDFPEIMAERGTSKADQICLLSRLRRQGHAHRDREGDGHTAHHGNEHRPEEHAIRQGASGPRSPLLRSGTEGSNSVKQYDSRPDENLTMGSSRQPDDGFVTFRHVRPC